MSRVSRQAALLELVRQGQVTSHRRAVALLVGTNRSVTDIALETGFSTASYLILCFREQYHMTPAQFREVYCG